MSTLDGSTACQLPFSEDIPALITSSTSSKLLAMMVLHMGEGGERRRTMRVNERKEGKQEGKGRVNMYVRTHEQEEHLKWLWGRTWRG